MALSPEIYEAAWNNDPAIRKMAERILREWISKTKKAETAWELTRLMESKQDPDKALKLILGIMALDKEGKEFGLLGAGPLEDFLNYSGPDYIEVIEKLAARNPRFKEVLGHVWQTSIMDLNVWERVEKVCGPKK